MTFESEIKATPIRRKLISVVHLSPTCIRRLYNDGSFDLVWEPPQADWSHLNSKSGRKATFNQYCTQ